MIEEIRKSIISLKNLEHYLEYQISDLHKRIEDITNREEECKKIMEMNENLERENKELKIIIENQNEEKCKGTDSR